MSYFDIDAPRDFSEFDSAFFALFRVVAGDPWVESIPTHGADGSINFGYVRTCDASCHLFSSSLRVPTVREWCD